MRVMKVVANKDTELYESLVNGPPIGPQTCINRLKGDLAADAGVK
jgi:hypothetical protein